MIDAHKLKSVEQYGAVYVKQYLAAARERHDAITNDPLAALAFMFGKAFMRGRRDAVSVVFRDRTLAVLRQYHTLQEIDLSSLDTQLRQAEVNNRHDRQMVRESIRLARDELQQYDCNVYNWAVAAIRHNRSAEVYTELVSIHAIKDKIATFYLRDVTFLEEIEASIPPEDYGYFQPVDTWVKRVARSLHIIEDADWRRPATIKEKIIQSSVAAEVSPLLFNAGAWMVGAHAYDLLIERL
jgi:hypothetical protein